MGKYAKAVVGALIASLGVLDLALADNLVTNTEWVRVGAAGLVSLGLVWGVQNSKGTDDVRIWENRG